MKTIPPLTPKEIARFWGKTRRSEAGCLEWTAGKSPDGYGRFTLRGQTYVATRVAWTIVNGPIPDGMLLCHDCPAGDNPGCVDPSHLFLGDEARNATDRGNKGRTATGDRSGTVLHRERYLGYRPGRARGAAKRRGEGNGRSVVTDTQVLAIKERYAAGGVTMKALGDEYGISKRQVGRIIHGFQRANPQLQSD